MVSPFVLSKWILYDKNELFAAPAILSPHPMAKWNWISVCGPTSFCIPRWMVNWGVFPLIVTVQKMVHGLGRDSRLDCNSIPDSSGII